MSNILSWIGKAAASVGQWFAKAFNSIETDAAPLAVTVVEEIQTLWKNGVLTFIADTLDSLTKSQVPTEIVNQIGAQLPKILSTLLAVEGLTTNPTDAQVQAFAAAVLKAWNITDDKSRIYTTLGAQIIGIIRANTAPGQKFTFAVLAADLEDAFQDWQTDQADPNA